MIRFLHHDLSWYCHSEPDLGQQW